MNDTMHTVIEVDQLTKKFGEITAVDNISLHVNGNELFGLLGPNGSGKTTIVKLLTGQIKPTTGIVTVLGIDVGENPVTVREKVGIIPEQENPPSFLTAEEYLHFVGKIRKLNENVIARKSDEWFNFLEFDGEREVLCKDLSRGTRQKLMFAQAFIHEPELAFVDEPLVNLDPIMQNKVKGYFKNFVQNGGTVFLCTHALDIAQEICTRIGILKKGSIVYKGAFEKKEKLEEFFLKVVKGD